MKNTVYLGLGSNIGDRCRHLREAVLLLQEHHDIEVEDVSSIYQTDPVGYTEQDKFLNLVIKISTNLKSVELLQTMQNIENHLGRTREIHWGPRTIDLDILLYNHENIETENLIVPHPRMFERAFVLIPLLEVYDELSYKISPSQLEEMRRQEGVVVWKKKNEEDVLGLFGS